MHRYPAKILLFGEHVLLLGATALSVPAPVFGLAPAWKTPQTPPAELFTDKLLRFAESTELRAVGGLDTETFKKDLAAGLYFRSDIPTGYGMGSSGALCAAVYDRYCREKTTDLAVLKSELAGMERFFHGASSGIDPLTSYLGQPLVIRNKNEVSIARMTPWTEAPVVFLLDTQQPRQTAPLVKWFMEQSRQPGFSEKLNKSLLPAHEAMVQAWLEADASVFRDALKQVSVFQLEQFEPMVPASIRPVWRACLAGDDVTLKVCGAGGGGYILGFARSRDAAIQAIQEFPLVFPFSMQHPQMHDG